MSSSLSAQLNPKKSLLKLKGSFPKASNQAQNSPYIPPKKQQLIHQVQKQQKLTNENIKKKNQNDEDDYKTPAQKAFDLVKKHRQIQKLQKKAQLSNKQRLQQMNKKLSKLPDHFDLSKTGQKIQKGY